MAKLRRTTHGMPKKKAWRVVATDGGQRERDQTLPADGVIQAQNSYTSCAARAAYMKKGHLDHQVIPSTYGSGKTEIRNLEIKFLRNRQATFHELHLHWQSTYHLLVPDVIPRYIQSLATVQSHFRRDVRE